MSADHVVPVRIYLLIFAALLVGTGATVWVAFLDLGRFNTVVALGIAIAKATLVILYFMHVRYSPGLTRLVIAAGIAWLSILIVFTLSDFISRGWIS